MADEPKTQIAEQPAADQGGTPDEAALLRELLGMEPFNSTDAHGGLADLHDALAPTLTPDERVAAGLDAESEEFIIARDGGWLPRALLQAVGELPLAVGLRPDSAPIKAPEERLALLSDLVTTLPLAVVLSGTAAHEASHEGDPAASGAVEHHDIEPAMRPAMEAGESEVAHAASASTSTSFGMGGTVAAAAYESQIGQTLQGLPSDEKARLSVPTDYVGSASSAVIPTDETHVHTNATYVAVSQPSVSVDTYIASTGSTISAVADTSASSATSTASEAISHAASTDAVSSTTTTTISVVAADHVSDALVGSDGSSSSGDQLSTSIVDGVNTVVTPDETTDSGTDTSTGDTGTDTGSGTETGTSDSGAVEPPSTGDGTGGDTTPATGDQTSGETGTGDGTVVTNPDAPAGDGHSDPATGGDAGTGTSGETTGDQVAPEQPAGDTPAAVTGEATAPAADTAPADDAHTAATASPAEHDPALDLPAHDSHGAALDDLLNVSVTYATLEPAGYVSYEAAGQGPSPAAAEALLSLLTTSNSADLSALSDAGGTAEPAHDAHGATDQQHADAGHAGTTTDGDGSVPSAEPSFDPHHHGSDDHGAADWGFSHDVHDH